MSTNNESALGDPDESGDSAGDGGFTEEQLVQLRALLDQNKKRSWRQRAADRVAHSALNVKDTVQGMVENATPPDLEGGFDTETGSGRFSAWLAGSVWRRVGIGMVALVVTALWCAVVLGR